MKILTMTLRVVVTLVLMPVDAVAAQAVGIEWQRLLKDDDADLRLKAVAMDDKGGILVLHTRRAKGASITAGELALWQIGAREHRARIEWPAAYGRRHEGADAVPMAIGPAGVAAIVVRTMTGLALLEVDLDGLSVRRARHLVGEADPLALEWLGDGGYRVATTAGLVDWPGDDDPVAALRLDSATTALAATPTLHGTALLVARHGAGGDYQPLVGVYPRAGADELRLSPVNAGVNVYPGRSALFGTADGAVLYYPEDPGPPSRWRRLSFDRDMNTLGADRFELPFEAGLRTSVAPLPGRPGGLIVSGGERPYWLGEVANGGRAVRWPMQALRSAPDEWEISMDVRALHSAANGQPVFAATYVYANDTTQKVDYAIHVVQLAFENGGDAHSSGGADGDQDTTRALFAQ